jgi:hypothetical protein
MGRVHVDEAGTGQDPLHVRRKVLPAGAAMIPRQFEVVDDDKPALL